MSTEVSAGVRASTGATRVAHGRRGAVAAGHELAAAAALDVLRSGGNAVDAAIAGSAVQCVVEMPWCGIGGDAFAMVRLPDGGIVSFAGSGGAPRAIAAAVPTGMTKIPRHGPLSVVVPGLVDAWAQLAQRLGTRPLAVLLAPAIALAADGVPLDRRLARAFRDLRDGGTPIAGLVPPEPVVGGTFVQRDLADTLRSIASSGRDGFYTGAVAQAVAAHVRAGGGALSVDDLAEHSGEWCVPIETRYRDAVVATQPPVSMGVLLLLALRLVERSAPEGLSTDLARLTDLLVEVKHCVFREALPDLGDPRFVTSDVESLLSDGWSTSRVPRRWRADAPSGSDTTTLAVTDGEGMTVSFIHSLFNEFGARELVPGTGIVLNDRLANVVVGTDAPNALAAGKRPMHTLHSWIATLGDGRTVAGATPGGRGQVQTNLQVLLAIIEGGLDPAAAVDAPRWVNGMPRRSPDDDTLYVEADFDASARAALHDRGHRVEVVDGEADDHFGCCTLVVRDRSTLTAVADRRRDASAVAF